jgi:hypothetical protein
MNNTKQRPPACANQATTALLFAGLLLATACQEDGPDPWQPGQAGNDAAVGMTTTLDAAAPGLDATIGNGLDSAAPDAAVAHPTHDGGHMASEDGGSGRHDCRQPYPKDPRDDTMSGELVRINVSNGQYEVQLPKEMLDWLDEHGWVQQHGNWHAVRRWDQGCIRIFPGQVCQSREQMEARGLRRAPVQEGEPGDGYAFLVMHRHMIQGLRQAFPKHAPQIIRGFSEMPTSKSHPENPVPWIDVRWSSDQLSSIEWMENVGQHLSAFTSEDDYGNWVQFGAGPGGFIGGLFGGSGGSTADRPGGGLHTGLHAQWSVAGSPSPLLDNNTNVRNYAFWRLHVWLDDMWERYRQAAQRSNQDPAYLQALVDQCEEMHALDERKLNPAGDAGVGRPDAGSVTENGVFATQVAPILNAYCGGSVCHGADSPTLGLALTGAAPSLVRQSLVDQQATEVSMALIKPGAPEQSWLFRKISDNFSGVDCSRGGCTKMPPAGAGVTAQELERIRAWIAAGASGD